MLKLWAAGRGSRRGKKVCLGFLFWIITKTMHYGKSKKVFFLMSLNFRNVFLPRCVRSIHLDLGKTNIFLGDPKYGNYLAIALRIGYCKLASSDPSSVLLSWQGKLCGLTVGSLQAQWMHRETLCFAFLEVAHKNVSLLTSLCLFRSHQWYQMSPDFFLPTFFCVPISEEE